MGLFETCKICKSKSLLEIWQELHARAQYLDNLKLNINESHK